MKIRARLKREGWKETSGGNHFVFKHPEKPGRVIVAKGRGDIAPGTARAIAKQAGWI